MAPNTRSSAVKENRLECLRTIRWYQQKAAAVRALDNDKLPTELILIIKDHVVQGIYGGRSNVAEDCRISAFDVAYSILQDRAAAQNPDIQASIEEALLNHATMSISFFPDEFKEYGWGSSAPLVTRVPWYFKMDARRLRNLSISLCFATSTHKIEIPMAYVESMLRATTALKYLEEDLPSLESLIIDMTLNIQCCEQHRSFHSGAWLCMDVACHDGQIFAENKTLPFWRILRNLVDAGTGVSENVEKFFVARYVDKDGSKHEGASFRLDGSVGSGRIVRDAFLMSSLNPVVDRGVDLSKEEL